MDDYRYMKKNPPDGVKTGSMVECIGKGTASITKGKKYRVRGCFKYLNSYGSGKGKFYYWDVFITIKNDNGWTIKVNLNNFKPHHQIYSSSESTKLEKYTRLENMLKSGELMLVNKNGELINDLNDL